LIDEHAQALREMNEEIQSTFKLRDRSPDHRSAWSKACERFHRTYDQLAFPGGLSDGLRRLSEADASVVDTAITFLEVDPWFFRSGYIKTDLIRYLKRTPLTDSQLERLRSVVLARIAGPDRREFRSYAQLASHLSTPEFERAVRDATTSDDSGVARRARWVLQALHKDSSRAT
jgi:hypothetical protein